MVQRSAGGQSQPLQGNDLRPGELPVAPSEQVVAGEQFLVFSLLGCELAIRAEYVEGVERLADVTPVPHVASWIQGVINLHGVIASVVDLRMFLGLESIPHNPRSRLLSVVFNEMVMCLLVDSVSEMVPIPSATIRTDTRQGGLPRWIVPYTSGYTHVNNRTIVLVDVYRLLFSEKMQQYSK